MKIKTEDLILNLSNDLKNPSPTKNWDKRYWFIWTGLVSAMATLTYLAHRLAPDEIHFPENLNNLPFWLEVSMWLGLALSASVIAFLSSKPQKPSFSLLGMAYVSMGILFVSLVSRLSFNSLSFEISNEMQLWRGPCGFFIALSGLASSFAMFFIMRQAAPVNLKNSATWAALSIGAASSMMMHLTCTHLSSAHVLIWHTLPLFSLILAARFLSEKFLRW